MAQPMGSCASTQRQLSSLLNIIHPAPFCTVPTKSFILCLRPRWSLYGQPGEKLNGQKYINHENGVGNGRKESLQLWSTRKYRKREHWKTPSLPYLSVPVGSGDQRHTLYNPMSIQVRHRDQTHACHIKVVFCRNTEEKTHQCF